MNPIVVPAGDAAAMVVFGDDLDLELNDAVLSLERRLSEADVPGVIELAPALATLLVRFDPLVTDMATIEDAVLEARTGPDDEAPAPGRRWTLPAAYGGTYGPDLEEVAQSLGVTQDEAVTEHASLDLRVLMLGFAPGFAYLGLADERWNLPRRASVRPAVPPGSLLVAVRQTAVGGTTVPTGWHVVGRTPAALFSPTADEPFLLQPGDRVSFEPIDGGTFEELAEAARRGRSVARRRSP